MVIREKSIKKKDSSVNSNSIKFNHSLVKINSSKIIWISVSTLDIQHLSFFIRQKGRLGVHRGVGRIVKAREHLPPSHYHAVSSRETEGIWAQREGGQEILLHPPSLASDGTS